MIIQGKHTVLEWILEAEKILEEYSESLRNQIRKWAFC